MPTQLDPTAQALTQALGQQESGVDYTIKGKSGEYGAYQMTPGFVQQYSPEILGQKYTDASQLTPDKQNELMYKLVEKWGTTGDPDHAYLGKLSPAQIASKINSGDPNAYLDPNYKGVNKYGASYDVPGYVKSVEKRYADNISKIGVSQPTAPNNAATLNKSTTNSVLSDWSKPGSLGPANILTLGGATLLQDMIAAHPQIASGILRTGGTAVGAGLGGPIGAIGGEVAGGVLADNITGGGGKQPPVSSGPIPSVPQPNTPSLAELTSLNNANSNSKKLADVYIQSLSGTEGGSRMVKDPVMQGGIDANSMFGLAPQIDASGRQDYTEPLQKSKSIVSGLSKQIKGIIATEDSTGNFDDARQEAKRIARTRLPETDWKEAEKHIDDAINTYQKHSNASMKNPTASLDRFDTMRSELGHGRKWGLLESTTKKEALKAVSTAARKEIEKNTKNKEIYNATMKMEANLLNGQKIMQKLHGKKAMKNQGVIKSLLHGAGNIAGAFVGEKIGGTMGAILGYLVENNVSKAVEKKLGATIFETKGMQKALDKLQKDSPAAYKVLVEKLKESNNPTILKEVKEIDRENGKPDKDGHKPLPKGFENMDSETIIETMGGWKHGDRVKFDTALLDKNAKKVKALLPTVPQDYKNRFKKEIDALLKVKNSLDNNQK